MKEFYIKMFILMQLITIITLSLLTPVNTLLNLRQLIYENSGLVILVAIITMISTEITFEYIKHFKTVKEFKRKMRAHE
ncbi:MAG: hypothetical protein CVU95_08415 [Firmicutes bacterium HGW-Firmicutes-2]|jgi:hypothetical protein|nr:MAG: hypothetical protein CVU95_08415 [Firmicutes bacterium HGW-Firmicutes-2]